MLKLDDDGWCSVGEVGFCMPEDWIGVGLIWGFLAYCFCVTDVMNIQLVGLV